MKTLISFVSTTLLMGASLYPLFFSGIGRQVSWPLVVAMVIGGIVGICILVRFRKRL